ncbi:MAG: hypothetical protein FWD14_01895 [Treponema sp.]|nr:hypothetical protein [Treponema sp.]
MAFRIPIHEIITGEAQDLKELIIDYDYNFSWRYLSMYVVKKLGIAGASRYIKYIPLEIEKFVEQFDLDFYEKYDINALKNIPLDFSEYFLNCLEKAGVQLYNDKDYEERSKVLEYLGYK